MGIAISLVQIRLEINFANVARIIKKKFCFILSKQLHFSLVPQGSDFIYTIIYDFKHNIQINQCFFCPFTMLIWQIHIFSSHYVYLNLQ